MAVEKEFSDSKIQHKKKKNQSQDLVVWGQVRWSTIQPAPSLFGCSRLNISRMHDRQHLPCVTGKTCPLSQKICPRTLGLPEWTLTLNNWFRKWYLLNAKKKKKKKKKKANSEEESVIANLLCQLELKTLADSWSDYFILTVDRQSSYTFQTFVMLFSYYPVNVLSTL